MFILPRLFGLLPLAVMLCVAHGLHGCGSEDAVMTESGLGDITVGPGDPNPGPPKEGGSIDPESCSIWPEVAFEQTLTSLDRPVHITHAGDGSGRLFLVEQPGRIRVARNNVLESAPFLNISSRVLYGGEQGLLALAFPPGYTNKGYFYVSYIREPDGASVIARYSLSRGNPDVANPDSEEVLLTVDQPFPIHNAGLIAFGPEGYLYISLGDGGSAGDSLNNAQNTHSLLGKILRIDVETGDIPYAVPEDNPFVDQEGYREEIWALGLRNPWRFSFDRQSGALYIADVGHNNWEEVNVQPPLSTGGQNYGWRITEGAHCRTPPIFCNPTGLTLPTYEYNHFLGCSIIGGFVYRGRAYPCLEGMYLYSDFCTGGVWGLKQVDGAWQSRLLTDTSLQFVSFGEDEEGELYALDVTGGVHILTLM